MLCRINMTVSDKHAKEFKKIFEKEYGKKITDSEAREYAERFSGFVEILFNHALTEEKRKRRLKDHPDGFFLDVCEGPYTCGICGDNYYGDEIWWNLDGLRCADCWRNIKEGVVPSLKHRYDNDGVWFQDWQINSDFGIHPSTARKLRREGVLRGIDLKRKDGTIYSTVYLVKDNKDFLKKYPKKPRMRVNFVNPRER